MLNVVADIGKVVSSGSEGDLLEFLIPGLVSQKYIVGIDFDVEQQQLKFDLLVDGGDKGLSKEKLQEYLLVPNERGMRPQFSPTSTNLSYLISQTLPNLRDFLPDDSELKQRLRKVCDTFFTEVQEQSGKKKAQLLNDQFLSEWGIAFSQEKEKLKEDIAAYAKGLADKIAEITTVPAKDTIYSIMVNGEPIAKHPDYQHFLLQKNTESAFEGAMTNTCAICGEKSEVTYDTTRFIMKFYMTDKVNFASYFDSKNYFKAVTACKSCYQHIIVAEKWIDQHLRTRLGGFDVYVLPQMVWTDADSKRIFKRLTTIKAEFNEIKNIDSLREAERNATQQAERRRVLEHDSFIWNLLFFRKSQSAFKVLSLIKDVPPTRITELTKATHFVDECRDRLKMPENFAFDLDQIYRLIPLRKRGADLLEHRKVLQIYSAIFNDLPIQKQQLYKFYTQLACTHHFESYGIFQIFKANNPDYALMIDTLKWNLFFLFLQKLELIDGGSPMETTDLDNYYPEGLKKAFTELGYNSAQQGLALLGYVIGVIANAQYREKLENKPVLEKINYQGMNEEKAIRLFNDAFEKIRQYRRHIGYAERWWALAKKLYESGANEKLTSDERVFYLLSGYAMNLLRAKPAVEETPEEEPAEI